MDPDYDDDDLDGICSPSNCTELSFMDCSDGCVWVDDSCRQSCNNKHHYLQLNDLCSLKPDCKLRENNGSYVMPCGPGCVLDVQTTVKNGLDAKCNDHCEDPLFDDADGDGICAPADCTSREVSNDVCRFLFFFVFIMYFYKKIFFLRIRFHVVIDVFCLQMVLAVHHVLTEIITVLLIIDVY
jgi:hypothetical protein